MSLVNPVLSPGLLAEMTSKPLIFGEVVRQRSLANTAGTREVLPGPPSPQRHLAPHPSRPRAGDEQTAPSSSRLVTPPKRSLQNGPPTPSSERKGKSPIKPLYPADIDLSWPSPFASLRRPAAGLYNPSMACYANATLQVLLHTPPVVRIIHGHDPPNCVQRKTGFCTLCLLRDMVGTHWSGKQSYHPDLVHKNLYNIKKGFNKNMQEDTHEFFRFVTDGLQTSALASHPRDISEKLKYTTWVHRVWGGIIRSRVICSRCKKPSDTFDSFLDLSIDVHPSKRILLEMLQGFVREDHLEGDNKYACENCKAKAVATKSFKIASAPPVLTFHLKRFMVEYNSWNGKARADKFNHHIEFPERLDIRPYMVDPNVDGTIYRLFGVTCHRGVELRFGHYTSYVRAPDMNWYHADDEDMSKVTIEKVLDDRTAYLLSYIRIGDDDPLFTAKTPTTVNGNRPTQAPLVSNGPRPPPYSDTRPTTALGHRPTIFANGHSSPIKRKREDEHLSNGDWDSKRQPLSDTVHQAPPYSRDAPSRFSPEHHPSRVFGAGLKPRDSGHPRHQIPESEFYQIQPDPKRQKRGKKKDRDKDKDNRRGSGPPMPFHQGQAPGGGRGGIRAPGMLHRMRGRI